MTALSLLRRSRRAIRDGRPTTFVVDWTSTREASSFLRLAANARGYESTAVVPADEIDAVYADAIALASEASQ